MRVFAVAQALFEHPTKAVGWFEHILCELAHEILADRCIVARRHLKSTHRELLTLSEGDAFVALQRCDNVVVLCRIDDNGDALVVFGSSAHHRWPTDVDVFDGRLLIHAFLGDGRFKRIEIDDHQVDRRDVHIFQRLHMFFCAAGEDPCMNDRMQRLHAAIEDLWEFRYIADFYDCNTSVAQCTRGAAGGKDLVIEFHQRFGKFYKSCFI